MNINDLNIKIPPKFGGEKKQTEEVREINFSVHDHWTDGIIANVRMPGQQNYIQVRVNTRIKCIEYRDCDNCYVLRPLDFNLEFDNKLYEFSKLKKERYDNPRKFKNCNINCNIQ